MEAAACMWRQRPKPRPLRCRSGASASSAAPPATPGSASVPAPVCRTCWEAADESPSGHLVAPCACAGSMRYVHARCLAAWQQQLRATKGAAAARRCDVCRASWGREHQPARSPTTWRQLARDIGRAIPWAALLECWRFSVLAVGAVQGMRAGVEGLYAGMRWAAAGPARHNLEWLAQLSPEMALAAGAVPPLKVPMAFCLAAFVMGLAAQVAVASMLCAYFSTLAGFVQGTTSCVLATLSLGGSALARGTLAARSTACGVVKGAAALGRLAAPVGMALMRTLALSRLLC